jgi:large conductance mechanosensitive channel
MLKEFREFALKGNAFDLAIGVIIGAAFGKIVDSLVNDVIMPPIGKMLGGVDFKDFFWVLDSRTFASIQAAKAATPPAPTLNYGVFVNTVVNFVIVAFSLFVVVKGMNTLRRQEAAPAAAPTTKACPLCRMEVPIAASKCGHCTSAI